MNLPVSETHLLYLFSGLLLSYFTGAFPSAAIAGRFKGANIREQGSGNPGAANSFRSLGWKSGIAVLVMDAAKGWLPAAAYAKPFFDATSTETAQLIQILIGTGAILGHCYPIFGRIKGGKGVATLAGVILAVDPQVLPFCLVVFTIAVLKTGYFSLGSILAAASFPAFLLTLPSILQMKEPSLPLLVFSLLIPWFIIFTHRTNIVRIRNGTENRITISGDSEENVTD